MITSFFYTNTESMNESTNAIGEFNSLNLALVKETKKEGNKIVSISQDESRVIFSSGTVFTYQGDGIYIDKMKICKGIEECAFRKIMQEEKEILRVFIKIGDFAKTMEYVVGSAEGTNSVSTETEANYTSALAKEYVQEGLISHYDGVNNTGSGHSNTTVTWRDLSNNHNDGLINNVTWGRNYAEFNGTTSWINCGKQNSNSQTIVVVFSLNNNHNETQCLVGNWENGGGGILINNLGRLEGEYFVEGSCHTYSNINISPNNIYQAIITLDGTSEALYLNGERTARVNLETQGTITVPENNTVMAMGTDPTGQTANSSFFDGKIYSVAIYNRALTESEITQTFKIDKEKYGIEI